MLFGNGNLSGCDLVFVFFLGICHRVRLFATILVLVGTAFASALVPAYAPIRLTAFSHKNHVFQLLKKWAV